MRTLPVAASVYTNNFMKKTKELIMLKLEIDSFKSSVSRTVATYKR